MTDEEAIETLRQQGYTVGSTAIHGPGIVKRYVVDKDNSPAFVEIGNELRALAAGEIAMEQIRERHDRQMKGEVPENPTRSEE